MISPQDIQEKAQKKYTAFLKSFVQNKPFFPLEIRFRKAKGSDDYRVLHQWVGDLMAGSKAKRGFGYRLELQERNHRLYGTQSLPAGISFETAEDFLKLISKTSEFARFEDMLALTRQRFPSLIIGLLARSPRKLLSHLDDWADILTVCDYFTNHPRPDIYLREIPVTVHSKFVENHQAILRDLLDELLPAEHILHDESHFARRFGLRYDEPQIRLRLLDASLTTALNWPAADLTLKISDCSQSAGLNRLAVAPVIFIVENKMNFLTLPAIKNGIVVWGKGFQVSVLKNLTWLKNCQIWYWGDIDAQGFEILSQARQYFPQIRSFLMDTETFHQHQDFVVKGTPAKTKQLGYLTAEEQTLYQDITQKNQRLEQENISQEEVEATLAKKEHISLLSNNI